MGEGSDVPVNEVNDCKDSLPSFPIEFEISEIYNTDETGLYFRAVPNRSWKLQNEKCKGGKIAKERL